MGDFNQQYLLVNFGGPRHLDEIGAFLETLLTDRDVIWTRFPSLVHNWLFRRIARKRALAIRRDYQLIGGHSPIFFDTEYLAKELDALTFHRYLPATHDDALRAIEASPAQEICVLPLFPQFTYATTGSIARLFAKRLSPRTQEKLRWIKSYPVHPAFVGAFQRKIREFLDQRRLSEEEIILLFSAHGVPQQFIDQGDPYAAECEASYRAISNAFPNVLSRLAYQSKFGKGEWLRPSTSEACETILDWNQGRKQVLFVPLTFVSDHVETLFEVEYQYLPLIRNRSLQAHRCPALNREPYWIEALKILLQTSPLQENRALIRT